MQREECRLSIKDSIHTIIGQGQEFFIQKTRVFHTGLTKENIGQVRSSLSCLATALVAFSIFSLSYFPKNIPLLSRYVRSFGYLSLFMTYEIERLNHYVLSQLELNLLIDEKNAEMYMNHCKSELNKTITVMPIIKLCSYLQSLRT